MLIVNKQGSRGDTLIEVLFATAIFSLVSVSGLAIMNQGTATSQRSLEITLVRNEIDSQATTLRFLNAAYIAAYKPNVAYDVMSPAGQWQKMENEIISWNRTESSTFGANGAACPNLDNDDFILNTHNAKFIKLDTVNFGSAQTYSQLSYAGDSSLSKAYGIWIEATRSATSKDGNEKTAGYIDFNIRACWDSPGQAVPITIGTIVRLYEPR